MGMINSFDALRTRVNNIIKVIPNNSPNKTQAADVKQFLLDEIDSVEDQVKQLGLSLVQQIAITLADYTKKVDAFSGDYTKLVNKPTLFDGQWTSLTGKPSFFNGDYSTLANKPDLTKFKLNTDVISYTSLSDKPVLFDGKYSSLTGSPTIPVLPDLTSYAKKTDIPTYDFSVYQKVSDTISYSRLTGVPVGFTGNYADLTGKPTLFSGSYLDLANKPSLFDGAWTSIAGKPSFFSGSYADLIGKPTLVTSYTQLTDKPNIPTYDLSLYRLKTDAIDYIALTNKPTIITDYSQLSNKPNMSKLLWNQTTPYSYLNSTTETNVLVAGNGNGTLNIEANPLVGTSFRFTGRGVFNTQTVTSPTLSIKLYLGSTVIATGSVSSLLIGAVNKPLGFYVDILVSATNSVYTQGSMTYFGASTDILSAAPITNNGVNANVDLSVVNQLKMTLTWSVANASNVIQMKIINLEKLNN